MKKLFASSLIGSSLLFNPQHAKADWDTYAVKNIGSAIEVYTCTSNNGSCSLVDTRTSNYLGMTPSLSYIDQDNNLIIWAEEDLGDGAGRVDKLLKYDGSTDTWTDLGTNWRDNYNGQTYNKNLITESSTGEIKIQDASGNSLLEEKSNGEIHIGENSWITKEENGRQKVYAKDAAGNPIPIDYTNGTKLLINGRDVEQSINNVGALSAALTGLPTVPTDTNLACGLGTGTHGGDFAFSGGCASKVNDKLSINYAASMTMPGQDYAGDFEDKFSARAGFVWKLGKATKPTQISMKETKELKKEISDLKENNNQIISQNKNLQLKNQSIISQNNALLARLERLEKVALGDLKSKDLAVYKLK